MATDTFDVERLALALSCWSQIGEGDPEFVPWAAQMIRAYAALAPDPKPTAPDLRVALTALMAAWDRVKYVVYAEDPREEDRIIEGGLTLDEPIDALRVALAATEPVKP